MSDIVDGGHVVARLRGRAAFLKHEVKSPDLMREAAAHIERLEAGYTRLQRILSKDSLSNDERITDALDFIRYTSTALNPVSTAKEG